MNVTPSWNWREEIINKTVCIYSVFGIRTMSVGGDKNLDGFVHFQTWFVKQIKNAEECFALFPEIKFINILALNNQWAVLEKKSWDPFHLFPTFQKWTFAKQQILVENISSTGIWSKKGKKPKPKQSAKSFQKY